MPDPADQFLDMRMVGDCGTDQAYPFAVLKPRLSLGNEGID